VRLVPSTLIRLITLLLLWVHAPVAFSQPADIIKKDNNPPNPRMGGLFRTTAAEICNNNTDDDNNGLTDEQDFVCYFNGLTRSTCNKSSTVWAIDGGGNLYWADLTTGAQGFVGTNSSVNSDITWASNGKLYACGGFPNGIYEIDPYTGSAQFVAKLPDSYSASVAMTADAAGNLYLVAYVLGKYKIVKLHIATWEQCDIADLSVANVFPSGDLTFLNGILYMSAGFNKLVKINVQTGEVSAQVFINSTTQGYFGMVIIGDGFLYVCQNKDIYQVNPATMFVNSTPSFTLNCKYDMYGLAGYYELCQAPVCIAKTTIEPNANPPYCNNLGVQLKAGLKPGCSSGITSVTWSWFTADGITVSGDNVTAKTPGKYYLNYQTATQTCNLIDSFTLQYATNAPLKVDTTFRLPLGCSCSGVMTVTAGCGSGNFKYEWSTGATTATVSNICPGIYTVKVTDLDWGKDTTIRFMIPAPATAIQQADLDIIGDHCHQSDGSITIDQVQGGIAPYQYALNNQPFGTGSTFSALPNGNYAITIRDNTGCSFQKQAVIQAIPGPEKIWYTKKDAYCGLPGGTIIIDSIKNGVSPYTYALGNSPFGQQTTFTNIAPGPHTLTVKDNYGCLLKEPLTINQSEALEITISPNDTTICASQKITFKATLLSNNAGVQYAWDGNARTSATTFNTAILADKIMIVQAIDKNGCTAADSAFVAAPYCDTLFSKCVLFPSAFSPNHNGLNDTFGPHLGSCDIKSYNMTIYNRWGQLIFHSRDALHRWNGEISGYAQPSGLYVFSCIWEDGLGFVHKHKGTVTLIR
jgi:gliding motility-associated-like protein